MQSLHQLVELNDIRKRVAMLTLLCFIALC